MRWEASSSAAHLADRRRLGSLILLAALWLSLAGAAFGSRPAPVGATDQSAQALSEINQYRAWLGVAPMKLSSALTASASDHAKYYQFNYGDPSLSGMGLHQEQPGKPGFTGADMQDRADAHGYDGWVNENIGLSGSLLTSLDWFMGTINHRLTLIDPRYTDIGFGVVNDGTAKIEVIDVGAPSWSDTATPNWVAWPPDGTTGAGTSFDGETPNPFAGASYPVGYPITLKYLGAGSVEFDKASLTSGATSIPVLASTGSGWLTTQTYQIAATQPLAAGTTYTVTASGTADGTPFTRTWSFRTAASADEPLAHGTASSAAAVKLPPGLTDADPAVQAAWQATDGSVADQSTTRTWLWGPDVIAAPAEPYAEAPAGKRQVYYFDKGRMEITNPNGDRSNPWFITNGLLVRDMIKGAVQVGNNAFQPSQPAEVPLAGDPADTNPDAPTYASLHGLATLANDHHVDEQLGQPVDQTLAKSGEVSTDSSLAHYTTLGAYDAVTGHNIATVFSDWLAGQSWNALMVVGRPISEPYWVRTKVGGAEQWVLIQAFERRLLTFAPSNPADWQIEVGNVGRAYYQWRYGVAPPGS